MQEHRQRQNEEDWAWLMADARGRRLAAELIEYGQMDEDLFHGNSRDAFNEGKRAGSRMVLRRARDNFEHYIQMLKEQNDERDLAG